MKSGNVFIWMGTGIMILATITPAGATALSDPTRPYGTDRQDSRPAVRPAGSWTLSSTLVSPQRRVAVINGRQVSEGEAIGNATVLRIRKLNVVLQVPDRRITLQLLPDILQRKP